MRPTDPAHHGSHGSSRYDDGVPHHQPGVHDEMHNVDVAHEHTDINVRAIVWSAVAVAVICAVTAGLMYVLFGQLEQQARAREPKLSPLAIPPTVMPPTTTTGPPDFGSAPEPRLLTNEPSYLQQLRERERNQLQGYAWIDEKAGVTRIPVDEAKKLLLERGLPVRPDAPADPRLGTRAAAYGESSSGRTITRPPAAPEPGASAPAPAPGAPHKGGH
jgi:hypothetical protein